MKKSYYYNFINNNQNMFVRKKLTLISKKITFHFKIVTNINFTKHRKKYLGQKKLNLS